MTGNTDKVCKVTRSVVFSLCKNDEADSETTM